MTYREPSQIIEEIDGGISKFVDGDYGYQNTNQLNGQSQYDFKYLSFPGDLGQENNGHYMVININVPIYEGAARTNLPASINGTLLSDDSVLNRLRDTKNRITGSSLRAPFGQENTLGAVQGEGDFVAPRNNRRIAESIALFMPNSLVYNTQHAYEDISLTAMVGSFGSAALSALGSVGGAIGRSIESFTGGGTGGQVARAAGIPINPKVEVLYAHTPQRQFVFEILMAARNLKESQTIKSIIKTLRYHSSAELTLKGFAFIPPASFDITFFNKGVENLDIPRINTCVLERIEADYSPTGVYSTFSTGHPVAIRLSLGFRELELVHKLRVTQNF